MGMSLQPAYRDFFFLGVSKLARDRDMGVVPAR